MSLRILYIITIFALSLLGAFLVYIRIENTSLSAFITLSAIIIPLFFLTSKVSKTTFTIVLPFILYCLYDLLGFSWTPFTIEAFQNFTVWLGMLMLFFISSISQGNLVVKIKNVIEKFIYVYIVILIYFIVTNDDDPATMMLCLLFYSYFLSNVLITKQLKPKEIFIMLFLILAPVFTGSRIIYISEIVITFFFILVMNNHSIKTFVKKLFISSIAVILLLVAFIALQERVSRVMVGGDNAKVAGIQINTSGRLYMWGEIWTSAQNNIMLGSGANGPKEMLQNSSWKHPHNDYLRLLHHNGIIGLVLWLLFFINLLVFLKRRISSASDDRHKMYYLFNLIYLFAIMIVMFTDNPIVYSYIMYTLMIISGSSIVVYAREKIQLKLIFQNEGMK